MSQDALEPLEPEEAVELYIQNREPDLTDNTRQNHRYRLKRFVKWTDQEDITNMNTITGRDLHRYRSYRAEHTKRVTLVNELRTLQKFLGVLCVDRCRPPGVAGTSSHSEFETGR